MNRWFFPKDEVREVCDGCWQRGVCERLNCKCSCTNPKDPWMHTDHPMNPRNKK